MALSLAPYLAAVAGINPMPPFIAASDMPKIKGPLIPRDPRPSRSGSSGTGNTYGQITDADPNDELRGPLWYGSQGQPGIAQKMDRDWNVRQTTRYVADPLGSCIWRFETKGVRPIDKEASRFVGYAFLEQPFWPRYRERAIANYMSCGFDLHEMTDDLRPLPSGRFPLHPGGGVGLVPTGFHEIPCNTVSYFHPSKSNPSQLDHVEQWQPYSDAEGCGWRDISADKIIRLTWGQEGANFAGFAPKRSAFGPWKLKIAAQTILAILHDRCGVPYPSIVLPPDCSPEDKDQVDAILEAMRSNPRGWMRLPNGSVFKWEQASCDDADNLRQFIIYCDNCISQNVSAGFMMLSLNDKTGSNALASTQSGQYHLSTVTHAGFVASGINYAPDGWSPVERIVRANYGPDVVVPTLVARNLPTHPWQETAKVAINAKTARAVRWCEGDEERTREWLGMDPYDPDREIDEPAPAAVPALGKGPNNDPMKQVEPDNNDMEPGHDNEPNGYGVAEINEAREKR